ncbi:Butyrophilin subfamily 3 member A3, partial [Tinamus guttatus]
VTLDPDTANARLLLARDRCGATWTRIQQDLPPKSQRFHPSCCVLGSRGFSKGRHRWEVALGDRGAWAIGVARESVRRTGWVALVPHEGIWALGLFGNRYRVFTSPATSLPAPGKSSRIQVSLDYGRGQVAFYLPGEKNPIFTFQNAGFGGERIFPFFWV